MHTVVLHVVPALLTLIMQITASAGGYEKLIEAAQDAVDWYRVWYANSTDTVLFHRSSSAWAALIDGRGYIALPDVTLGVEFVMDTSLASPTNVGRLPRQMGGREAVDAYVDRLRNEAEYVRSGKANRFNLPGRRPDPWVDAIERGRVRIIELGTIALPRKGSTPVSEEEQLRFASAVRAALRADPGLAICGPTQATIPKYGIRDPVIFVLVETTRPDCGDFVFYFRRQKSEWHYDQRSNRFRDVDEIIQRIRSYSNSVLTF